MCCPPAQDQISLGKVSSPTACRAPSFTVSQGHTESCYSVLPVYLGTESSLCPLSAARGSLQVVQYCPSASELGCPSRGALCPLFTIGFLPNVYASSDRLLVPCVECIEAYSAEKQSLLLCLTSHVHRFWLGSPEDKMESLRPGRPEWREHQNSFCFLFTH